MKTYANKVAVVTGAGSGIGRALAIGLAQRGARLALSDVNEAGLAETLHLCQAVSTADMRAYRLDVASREAFLQHAEQVQADFGTAHFLFNNAGVTLGASVEHSSIDDIQWQLGINLWGVIHGTKAFLPLFLAQREGHIVNISSVMGLVGAFGQGAYNISKFGVRGLTECLWSELRGTGVSATTVHPGGIKTAIDKSARLSANKADIDQLQPAFEKMLVTPPEVCAEDILIGVSKGKRKILTGHGARLMDFLARAFPTRYPEILRAITGL